MLANDPLDAMKEHGVPEGITLGVLSGLGAGVNTYDPLEMQQARERERLLESASKDLYGTESPQRRRGAHRPRRR